MASSSILGGQRSPTRAEGRDTDALGPSDSSDSGSDVQGERSMSDGGFPVELDSDTDASGTGERAGAVPDSGRDGADILPDRIDQGLSDPSGENNVPIESISADEALQLAADEDDIEDDDEEGDDYDTI